MEYRLPALARIINGKQKTVNNRHRKANQSLWFPFDRAQGKKVYGLKLKLGFSLIELLIVISLFALVAVIVTVSYIGYETREQVKNAALQLKTDLRLAQNKAKTGDKGLGSGICATGSTLAGWYINVDATDLTTAGKYAIGGVCLTSNGVGSCTTAGGCEAYIGIPRSVSLPSGVAISGITYGSLSPVIANVLFRPVNYIVTFHSAGAPPLPNFFNDTIGALGNYLTTSTDTADLVITLAATDGGSYQLKVTRFGDIEEKKI